MEQEITHFLEENRRLVAEMRDLKAWNTSGINETHVMVETVGDTNRGR